MSSRFAEDFPIDHTQWREAPRKTVEDFVSSLGKRVGQNHTDHDQAELKGDITWLTQRAL